MDFENIKSRKKPVTKGQMLYDFISRINNQRDESRLVVARSWEERHEE